MGNSESANPIRNMDKRTARREYRQDFSDAILSFRQRNGYSQSSLSRPSLNDQQATWQSGAMKIYARKRPIFAHEVDNCEFDVITCLTDLHKVIVHDCRMHNDMKHEMIHHHEFVFDNVFHESANNDYVYGQTTRPLIEIGKRVLFIHFRRRTKVLYVFS